MIERAAVIINFPVKPHVYKYLQKKCGEKLIVSKTNFFGSTILDILSKKHSRYESVTMDLLFPAEISMEYMRSMGIYLDDKIIRKFNTRVDDLFREEMRTYCDTNFEITQIPKEKSLKQLLFYYNISEEDIKFETLVKDLRRNT